MILTVILLTGFGIALVATGLAWARQRPAREEPYYHFRCPDCSQKVRYLASKAGRPGMCPRCRQLLTLPETPQQMLDEQPFPVGSSPANLRRLQRQGTRIKSGSRG